MDKQIGQWRDTIDNALTMYESSKTLLPAQIHLDALSKIMARMRDEMDASLPKDMRMDRDE